MHEEKDNPKITDFQRDYRIRGDGSIALPDFILDITQWNPADRVTFSWNATNKELVIRRIEK